jgi:predicted lysophospholipase L1 biosynthesis ABC-type transport system permease subunit
VVLISSSLARSVWGESNPVGSRIAVPFFADTAEVIGVAGDVRTTGLDGEAARTVYVNVNQGTYNFMTAVVKTANDPRTLAPVVRQLVRRMDPDLPLHHVRTMDDLMARSVSQQRFQVLLVGAFSVMVFILAVIGTYGVASYSVSERTGELGIRMALGATGGDIRGLVLQESGRLTFLGIGVGAAAAGALSGTLSRFVFEISTLDWVTFTLAPLALATATLVATLIPAHRATKVDPIRVLRVD